MKPTSTFSRTAKMIPNALKAAVHHRGLGRNPKRRFFALAPHEVKDLIAEAARTLRIQK